MVSHRVDEIWCRHRGLMRSFGLYEVAAKSVSCSFNPSARHSWALSIFPVTQHSFIINRSIWWAIFKALEKFSGVTSPLLFVPSKLSLASRGEHFRSEGSVKLFSGRVAVFQRPLVSIQPELIPSYVVNRLADKEVQPVSRKNLKDGQHTMKCLQVVRTTAHITLGRRPSCVIAKLILKSWTPFPSPDVPGAEEKTQYPLTFLLHPWCPSAGKAESSAPEDLVLQVLHCFP